MKQDHVNKLREKIAAMGNGDVLVTSFKDLQDSMSTHMERLKKAGAIHSLPLMVLDEAHHMKINGQMVEYPSSKSNIELSMILQIKDDDERRKAHQAYLDRRGISIDVEGNVNGKQPWNI